VREGTKYGKEGRDGSEGREVRDGSEGRKWGTEVRCDTHSQGCFSWTRDVPQKSVILKNDLLLVFPKATFLLGCQKQV
jgi:hypothetical protein